MPLFIFTSPEGCSCVYVTCKSHRVDPLPRNITIVHKVTIQSRFIILNLTLTATGSHNILWPESKTFLWSTIGYQQLETASVHCGQRPQHLKTHRTRTKWLHYSYTMNTFVIRLKVILVLIKYHTRYLHSLKGCSYNCKPCSSYKIINYPIQSTLNDI